MEPATTGDGDGRRPQSGPLSGAGNPSAHLRRWPLGPVGMLAIVIAAEMYVSGRHVHFGTNYSVMWRWAGRAVRREATRARVLCFGSSLTQMGVSPSVLEERLGKPAYNFATSGGQPYSIYTTLRHALEAGSKPEAVVVDFTWSALAMPYDWNERVLPELATFCECVELAVASHDPNFLARLALIWWLPTLRCRAEIRSNILAAICGEEAPGDFHHRHTMVRNANVNRGGIHATPLGWLAPLSAEDTTTFPAAWECASLSEHYLHKFLDLAESRGVPVFWLVPPVAPPTQSRRDELNLEARYTRFIEGAVGRHRGVVVVDGRHSRYGTEAFLDTVHLNRDGAVAFTDGLAEVIRSQLRFGQVEGSRWVRLPEYRPDPMASRVEDMLRSSAAVDYLQSRGLLR